MGTTEAQTAFNTPTASEAKVLNFMAEGARFELAAHGVGAGFQDRWIKPLSHPSIVKSETEARHQQFCYFF